MCEQGEDNTHSRSHTRDGARRNPVVFLFLGRFCIRDPRNVHTHSTQRVTITKFLTCTFKRKITDLDPSETQSYDASRGDKVQIPKPCFLLYFLPFHWIFLLNRVPFRHLLYESATFSFRGNPKEIYLVSKIFLILTKVLHTALGTLGLDALGTLVPGSLGAKGKMGIFWY